MHQQISSRLRASYYQSVVDMKIKCIVAAINHSALSITSGFVDHGETVNAGAYLIM